jgi:two-component system chemotaxis response regulator CheB
MNCPFPVATNGEIRVLLVDDSPIAIEIIRSMLANAPDIDVVGTAGDGVQALELIPRLRPDVICTDLHMPNMDGLKLTREIMARHRLPILVMSISVQPEQTLNIFQMLEAGAVDILAKPRGGLASDIGVTANDLITKIRVLSGVRILGQRGSAIRTPAGRATISPLERTPRLRIVGIGASTGGPQALECILSCLPADFPVPLICVQHIADGFMQGMVNWLAKSCRIPVRTAVEGSKPVAGVAYFPPDNRHLEINAEGSFRCSAALPFTGHRPSVDIAFDSLALRFGAASAGVLLTGMGEDGAQGLLAIRRAGGFTIAQDEESSVVFGMPGRAVALGAAKLVLPLDQIATTLIQATQGTVAIA